MDQVQATVSNHCKRISFLESHADSPCQSLLSLEGTCAKLTASIEKLRAKAADLEARSRRNNLCIVGLLESIEGPRPTNFFITLLIQLLGDQILPSPPKLEHAHQSLAPKPQQGERPRPAFFRFHNYQSREKALCEARIRRSDLRYKGKLMAILEDLTPEVAEQ